LDRHTLVLFIPILALSIPVLAIALHGLQKYWQIRLEEARIRAGVGGSGAEAELSQLRGELDQVRQELAEVQERVDFTERLLAKSTERDRLPSPPSSS
jgi:Tfp pilus assembly protein PilO